MSNSRAALIALTSAAVLAMTACGSGDDGPDNPDDTVTMGESSPAGSSSSSTTSSDVETTSESEDGSLSAILAAIEAAEVQTGGVPYDIDDLDGDDIWEINLAKDNLSLEVEVSPTGDVLEKETDGLHPEVREGLDTAQVPLEEAIRIAMKKVDGLFHDAELEEENGQHHWEVSIDTADTEEEDDDHQIRVDVTDGRVTVVK